MKREDSGEIRKRASVFCEERAFTFVKELAPNGRENFYNGFIIRVYEDIFSFFDVVIKRQFPILIDHVIALEPSRKDMELKVALELLKREVGNG